MASLNVTRKLLTGEPLKTDDITRGPAVSATPERIARLTLRRPPVTDSPWNAGFTSTVLRIEVMTSWCVQVG
jgi:hypothetical protein